MLDFIRNITRSEAERLDERISGYLDGTLPVRDRRRLERQMDADPALRANVQQMQAIRQAMRRLPRRPAPRNFTLSPAQAGQLAREPAWTPYPILRTATVLVALVLAAVLVFDLGFYRGGLAAPAAETVMVQEMPAERSEEGAAAEMPAEPAALELAVSPETEEMEVAVEQAAEAPVAGDIAELAPAEEVARQGEAESEAVAAEVVEEPVSGTQAPFAAQTLPEAGTGESVAVATASPAPAPAPMASPTVAPTVTLMPLPTVTLMPQPTLTPRPPVPTATPTQVPEPEPSVGGLNPLLMVEIALGGGALLLAVLTWLARRRAL